MRTPCSTVGSYSKASCGVRFIRSSRASRACRTPCAAARPVSVRFRFVSEPSTLDEDARVAQVGRGLDPRDRDEADPRVLQIAEALGDHLAHRLVHSPHPVAHSRYSSGSGQLGGRSLVLARRWRPALSRSSGFCWWRLRLLHRPTEASAEHRGSRCWPTSRRKAATAATWSASGTSPTSPAAGAGPTARRRACGSTTSRTLGAPGTSRPSPRSRTPGPRRRSCGGSRRRASTACSRSRASRPARAASAASGSTT